MMPSLDIYSFGMVVLFLFLERNLWHSLPSLDIAERKRQLNALVTQMEGIAILQGIGEQVRAMLDPDPTRRPTEATDCLFELHDLNAVAVHPCTHTYASLNSL